MKRLLIIVYDLLRTFGVDPVKTIRSIKALPYYLRDFKTHYGQRASAARKIPLRRPYPCLEDRFVDPGSARGHYFHQDLLVARRIHLNSPCTHVDVGSRVDGFVAHVASFRQVIVIDIHSQTSAIPNIQFIQADLMVPLRDELLECCDSLSCLHALEHFGLGRYGDTVNYDGHLVGLNNLYDMLKKSGKLYISVPIGPPRIEFNAHRVFATNYLIECFDHRYRIDQFSFVDDQGNLHENVPLTETNVQNNFGCVYGCAILEMTKL